MKQLLTFFALAFLISWIIWLSLYSHIFGMTNVPTLPFNHAIGALGTFNCFLRLHLDFFKKRWSKKVAEKNILNYMRFLITIWGILIIIIFKPKNLSSASIKIKNLK